MSYSALSPSARLVFCLIGSACLARVGRLGSLLFRRLGRFGCHSLPWVVDSAAAAVEEESAAHARSWTKGQVARCQLCCRRRRQLQLLHDRCDGRWDDYFMIVFAGVFSSTFDLSKKNRCTSSCGRAGAGAARPGGVLREAYRYIVYCE